ncbi:MAG: aldo/keto reductase [Aquificaceae bacterium]
MVEKFVLGTANFGMEYGIACGRKLSKQEAFEILDIALFRGIWGVDTAVAYGEAHNVLGEYVRQKHKSFRVITKLPAWDYQSCEDVYSLVIKSLETLGIPKLKVLMIHSFQTFTKYKDFLIKCLKNLKKRELIENYGISVYHPEEVFEFYKFTEESFAVEFPINVFDRRFLPYLKSWKGDGLELFARSIFLQGLFFLEEEKLKGVFQRVKNKIISLRELSKEFNISVACICLNFVASFEELDGIVVGVDNPQQLINNFQCLEKRINLEDKLRAFEVKDEDILLPYRWYAF